MSVRALFLQDLPSTKSINHFRDKLLCHFEIDPTSWHVNFIPGISGKAGTTRVQQIPRAAGKDSSNRVPENDTTHKTCKMRSIYLIFIFCPEACMSGTTYLGGSSRPQPGEALGLTDTLPGSSAHLPQG